MDYKNVMDTIDVVYKDRNSTQDKYCILVNGEWGIGKTYTINQWIAKKKDSYNFTYVSVFGKDSLRAIENEIILKVLFDTSKNADMDLKTTNTLLLGKKIGSSLVKQVLSSKLGLALEAVEYVKDIAIENLNDPKQNNKETIVCLDDLERKLDAISIKSMLGLIERVSKKFNIIIIANSSQFDEIDMMDFKKYKEKVIDYEFIMNTIDDKLMKDIIRQSIKTLNEEQINKIISTYKKPFEQKKIKVENQLLNIRVFKKYIALIAKVYKEVKFLLNATEYELDNEIIESCKTVICHYYFNDNIDYSLKSSKKNTITLREGSLNKTIYKIFKYESYDVELLKDLISNDTEISKDIRNLYNIFKLSHEQTDKLLRKIQERIEEKDLSYFLKQVNVISLFDSLNNSGCPMICCDDLLEIANMLYSPKLEETVPSFDSDEWFDVGFWGGTIPCNKSTAEFIRHINVNNRKKYVEYRNEEFIMALSSGNIEVALNVLKGIKIKKTELFEKVFLLAEKELDSVSNSKSWQLLYRLLESTEYEIALQYLNDKLEKTEDFLDKRRLEHLKDVLEEQEYYRQQMEEQAKEYAEENQ